MRALYFIAILPDEDHSSRINSIKLSLKKEFGIQHALKSPPHITLQMPFKWEEDRIFEIEQLLSAFSNETRSFDISLSGFGHFSDRVIFISVNENEKLERIKLGLDEELIHKAGFPETIRKLLFHPHITLAHRDLTKKRFHEIWPLFVQEQFTANFRAKEITLLKHRGIKWEIYKKFNLKD